MRDLRLWMAMVALGSLGCSGHSNSPGNPDAAGGTGGEGGRVTVAYGTTTGSGITDSGITGSGQVTAIAASSSSSSCGSGAGGGGGSGASGGSGGTAGTDTAGGAGGEAGATDDVASACPHFDHGSLEVSTVDADCDTNTPDECESGTHIDFDDESSCAVCVADNAENRSCSWATSCFEPFVQTIAYRSGAKRCEVDGDCSKIILFACGQELSISLNASIDEEIGMVAEMYVEQNCSLCADDSSFHYDVGGPEQCIQGVCTLLD